MTKKILRFLMSRLFLSISFIVLLFVTIYLLLAIAHYKDKSQNLVRILIDADLLKEKLTKAPPQWMLNQIDSDLLPFAKSGITSSMIDQLFQGERIKKFHLARFRIEKGHLSYFIDDENIDSRQFRHTLAAIRKINELTSLPDVDFVVSIEDGFNHNPNFPHCPCFTFSKGRSVEPFVLMPDFKALTGYPSLREEIAQGKRRYGWERKKNICFWRGSSTGDFLTASNWDQIPRSKLVLLSLMHPNDVDARFAALVQCNSQAALMMQSKGMLAQRVSQGDHLKCKYLIDVDGNSCTFERLFWILLSNSVTFKQMSANIQWYYSALEPYRHYIPIKEDISDLLEKIQWAKEHDSEAKQIADNAQEFVRDNLSIEDVYLYLYHLITAYARLET